jgi:exodeoxyribonuclease V alpha subunit
VLLEMLDNLELGCTLTAHEPQGSQWRRLIVVLTGSAMLDRIPVYTAIIRAQEQVIIAGEEAVACAAVEAPPLAGLFSVELCAFLLHELAANN